MTTTIVQNSFLPTQISGCQLWLDAADPSVVIKSGTTVTAWNDKSGNGNNGTASGSPVLLANSLNGSYPSIYFNGSSSIAGATVVSGTTLTAFCILQTTDANLNTNGRLLSLSAPGRNDYDNVQSCIPYDQFNNAQINTNRGNTGTPQVVYNVPVGTSALVATIFDGNTSNIFYANGSLYVTATAASWNQSFSITTYCIGNAINPNSAWYKGRIGEIILYSTALSNQQRQKVEGYLAAKWGLQTSLPSNHPYRYSAYFTNLPYVSTIVSPTNTNQITNASFLPTQIPGCALWLDGKDTSSASMTLSGTTVTTWKDKSGNGYNASGVNSPQLVSSGGVSFNGSQYFTLNAAYSQRSSVFMVATGQNSTSVVGGQYYWNFNNTNQGGNIINNNSYFPTSPLFYYDNVNGSSGAFVSGNTLVNPFLVSVVQTPGTSIFGYYNGSQAFTNSYTAGTATAISVIGAAINTGASPINGIIYEIIFYNAPLTTSQRQQVEGYLAWKWGLAVNLPPTHPYKKSSAVFVTQPNLLSILGTKPYNNTMLSGYFNPTSIAGTQLWLDAADPSVVIKSGTTVTAWNDKSGNGYNMNALPMNQYQGNGNAIYPSVGTPINKLSTIYFAPWAGLKQATVVNGAKNLYWVGRISSDSTDSYFLMGADITYDWHANGGANTTILANAYAQSGLLAASPASQYTSGANAVVNTTFSNIVYPSAGDISLLSIAGITGNTRYQGVCFDRQDHTGWCGDLAEVVIYSTALTTAQHQQVEGYLAWKWGLQANLPPTHPYKSFPPPP